MNNESLRIRLVRALSVDRYEWLVTYHGWAETPIHPENVEGQGYNEVGFETELDRFDHLYGAQSYARDWAVGSGFKAGPLKPALGDTLEIRLRRP